MHHGFRYCMIIGVVVASGCATPPDTYQQPYQVNGATYGVTRGVFRPRWWNFYERGRSFADGGFLAEAERDLQRAVKMRKTDHRRSRTYGLHFVRYFGNREYGIVLYRQGRSADALPYLERSLDQDPTEKAEYYLSRCRLDLADIDDHRKPEIALDDVPPLINTTELRVSGRISDDGYIDRVRIHDAVRELLLKDHDLAFSETLALLPGPNTITFEARDIAGNTTTLTRHVTVDIDPPMISLDSRVGGSAVIAVHDAHAVTPLAHRIVNAVCLPAGANRFTLRRLSVNAPMYVEFADAAGNRNGMRIPAALAASGERSGRPLLRSLEDCPRLVAGELQKGMLSGERPVGTATGTQRTDVIRIELEKMRDDLVVFQDHVLIAGRIHGAFAQFSFDNDVKLANGRDVRFCFRKDLTPGMNQIALVVVDENGTRRRRHLRVERRMAPQQDRELRAKVVLCPLAREGGDRDISRRDFDNVLHELNAVDRFRLLESDRLDVISREFGLIKDGWIRTDGAARVGRALNADYSLACTFRPTAGDVEIFARLIDAETQKVLATCDVYAVVDGAGFGDAYTRFVQKLVQIYPVVEQPIHKMRGQKVLLNVGANANLKEGMKFVAYHRGPSIVDSETGQVLVRGRIHLDAPLNVTRVKRTNAHLNVRKNEDIGDAEYVVSL